MMVFYILCLGICISYSVYLFLLNNHSEEFIEDSTEDIYICFTKDKNTFHDNCCDDIRLLRAIEIHEEKIEEPIIQFYKNKILTDVGVYAAYFGKDLEKIIDEL